jgi:hypothetical protein
VTGKWGRVYFFENVYAVWRATAGPSWRGQGNETCPGARLWCRPAVPSFGGSAVRIGFLCRTGARRSQGWKRRGTQLAFAAPHTPRSDKRCGEKRSRHWTTAPAEDRSAYALACRQNTSHRSNPARCQDPPAARTESPIRQVPDSGACVPPPNGIGPERAIGPVRRGCGGGATAFAKTGHAEA